MLSSSMSDAKGKDRCTRILPLIEEYDHDIRIVKLHIENTSIDKSIELHIASIEAKDL